MRIASRILGCVLVWSAGLQAGLAGQVVVTLAPGRQAKLEFDGEAQILFFPQIHAVPDMSRKDRREALLSQYCLATFLRQNPHYEVFVEGELEGGPEPLSEESSAFIQGLFPGRDLPGSLAALTEHQEEFLVRAGGARVLFYLGLIPGLHAAVPEALERTTHLELGEGFAKSGRTFDLSDPRTEALVKDVRERGVADQVRKFLASQPTKKVLIVFGMAHDFRSYFPGSAYAEFTGLELFEDWRRLHPGPEQGESKGERKDPSHPAAPSAPPGMKLIGIDKLQANHRTRLMNAVTAQNLDLVRLPAGPRTGRPGPAAGR